MDTSSLSAAKKKLMIGGGLLAVVAVLQYQFNIIPMKASKEAVVPLAVELAHEAPELQHGTVEAVALPSTNPTKMAGPYIRTYMYAWTAQAGISFANGGAKTTQNSLMEKNGIKVQLTVQSDLNKSQAEQIKFAERLASGDSNPGEGAHFVIMMGDGSAQYIAGINKALDKLGPEYRAEIIGAIGYSGNSISGEDACMGPAEWQEDPTKAQGGLIAGYLRDGDWNLCLYWAQQNGIKNNPDETTYDPTAINWLSTDDHLKAAQSYISGYCEDRKVVIEGKVQSKKERVCVSGVATWTPGDVNIAKQKGGLVKLISTKENAYQMPAVVIGIKKWNQDHSKQVQSFLKASFEGADQVRSHEAALQRAGKAMHNVFGEESPAYWVRYYKGVVERDKTNNPIPLGGSRVANLGDNLVLFGLAEGAGDLSSSIFKATYEGFGNVVKQQYPKLFPEFPPVIEAVNTSYLQALSESTSVSGRKASEVTEYQEGGSISEVVAKRNWQIQFQTGSATFTPAALATMEDLYNQLAVNKLAVEIEGHTDNTGSDAVNIPLSQQRAEAVRQYLEVKAPNLFPANRFKIEGYGATKPVAPNETADGKAKNRRVTITMGNK